MSTKPLEPQPPAVGPIQEPSVRPPRPFTARISGCLQQLRGQVAVHLRRLGWRIVGMVLLAVASIMVWRTITVHARPQITPAVHAVTVAVARGPARTFTIEGILRPEFRLS